MSYIKCENLTVGYDNEVVAHNLHFNIEKGDYICIVGENGAGKTTLMKTILHLIKPIEGELEYGDGLMPYDIGYLPQQTVIQQDFPASVYEVCLSGNLAKSGRRPFYGAEDRKRTKMNMKKMGIYDLKGKSFKNLSGGQRQRVLLSRALCASDKLLVLDEPVNGLDPKATAELYGVIKSLNEEGMTVIMVSHDLQEGLKDANKILHISGKQLFFGNTKDYMKSDAFKIFKEVEDIEQRNAK